VGQSRKVVTVLFADVVGSTSSQEHMDPESVRRDMDRFYVAMRQAVETHGGRVVKFIGDAVMAVFGVPYVREDDARRALAAAAAMRDAVVALADANIALRVGVNTGEVVVTADDYDVVGDVVNVASRLEHAAGPRQILVGESTWRLVRFRARLRALPPLTLKGRAEPVQAFQLLSLDPGRDSGSATPFIGRTTELGRLLTTLDDAISAGMARLVTIVGSPGVGKTRLARELATAAQASARVVEMRCDPALGVTFGPIAEALRLAASLAEDASDETILAALTALLDEGEPDRERIAVRAAALMGVGEPGLPEESFWAVRRLVEATARVRPVMLVFDDVHWAEPLLLDLIEYLSEWIRDAPVLLVSTARPEVREIRPSLVKEGAQVAAVIPLEGLPAEESRLLACELLGVDHLPELLLERLASASEGNPLFVGELVRMLVDDGALRREGDSWVATVDLAEVDVPLTIHALLSARIDRLAPRERAVLEVASVIGRTFYRGAVAELGTADARAELDVVLEQLHRKELVDRTGTYWIDEPVLRFHHVLIRDAAYRRLLKDVRANLHERVADWLESKAGDLVEHDDAIGYQLERAYRLRLEGGVTDADLGRRAAERLSAAGRRALEAEDRPAAASLISRAVECLDPADADVPGLLIDECDALLAAGDVNAAVPVVAALERVAEGSGRLEAWADCYAGELANLTDPAHLANTAARSAEAATRLSALGDLVGEAKAQSVRAQSLRRLGHIAECEATLDRALAAARAAGDRRRATSVLAGAPVAALWGPNPVTRASGRCLDVVRVLRITRRSPAVEATSMRCQAVLEALRGRIEAARRMLETTRSSLEELGHAHGLLEIDLAAGMVETIAGDLGPAEENLRRAHDGFAALGIDVDAGLAAAILARVCVAHGAFDDAIDLTMESELRGGDDLKTAIAWRAVRAEALAHAGHLDEARRLAEQAVELAQPTDALVDHADALMALATVMRVRRDEPAARTHAQRALGLYERKGASVLAHRVREFLGQAEALPAQIEPTSTGAELPPPENGATRSLRCSYERARSGDWLAYAETVADGATYEDRRPDVGFAVRGRDAFVGAARHGAGAASAFDVTLTPQITRADRLALVHGIFPGKRGRLEAEALQLIEVDESSRLATTLIYNMDQHAAAAAELEARYMARSPFADTWLPASLWVEAINTRDWMLLRRTLADDFVAVDHRPLGWGTIDADQFVELYRSPVELAPDVRAALVAVHAISSGGACVRAELRGTTSDGGPFRTSATIVTAAADKKLTRCDFFPELQPEVGIALLHGRGRDADDLLDNAASVAFRQLRLLWQSDDWSALADRFALGVVTADHRRVVGSVRTVGRHANVQGVRRIVSTGLAGIDGSVVALRGETLCLVQATYRVAAGAIEVLQVIDLDEEGRVAANDVFDPERVDDAIELLDSRFLARHPTGGAAWRAYARTARALNARDFDAVRASLTDHLEVIDNRPLSFGNLDREGYMSLFPPLLERSPDVRWTMVSDLGVTDHTACFLFSVHGTINDGGAFTTLTWLVCSELDGRLASMEAFASREDVMRRFEELVDAERTSEAGPPGATPGAKHDGA
jgi:class 3 adenylate cyclase/tetratricopeptide (TPR) repeat protein